MVMMMGSYYTTKILISLSLLVSLIIIAFAYPTLSLDQLPRRPDNFPIKKTAAPLFVKRERVKREKFSDARRFSAMLPKGYVPPSGSSPCHNVYPNSVSFFCDYPTLHEMQKP